MLMRGVTGKILVVIGGNEYYGNISNNIAIVNVSGLKSGHYTANISYFGDEKYSNSSNNTLIIVKKILSGNDLNIIVGIPQESTSSEFTIKLPSDATGNLTVIVDGKTTYTKSLVNGEATINVGKLSSGKHNIQVIYSGDTNYSVISKRHKLIFREYPKRKLQQNSLLKTGNSRQKLKSKNILLS